MKPFLIAHLLLFALRSSAQTSPDTIPKELLTNDSTYWTFSTLSNLRYVNTQPGAYYGTTTGGGGMIGKYKFYPGNRYRFQLYVQVNSYGTRTETWTDVEGSVRFSRDEKGQAVFFTTAEKGLYRIINNGKVTQRAITETELAGQHSGRYLWERGTMKDDTKNTCLFLLDLKAHPGADANDSKTFDPSWVSVFRIPVNQ
jgi:hypothetical protein